MHGAMIPTTVTPQLLQEFQRKAVRCMRTGNVMVAHHHEWDEVDGPASCCEGHNLGDQAVVALYACGDARHDEPDGHPYVPLWQAQQRWHFLQQQQADQRKT